MPAKKENNTPKKESKAAAATGPASPGIIATENGNSAAAETSTQMSADELDFIVACLTHNVNGGPIPVDCNALAETLGYKNPGSVVNRLAKMKKKFGLNLSATTSSPRKDKNGEVAATSGANPKVPITPSKNRVTKSTRGRAVPKKSPTKKSSYAIEEVEDEEMYDGKENVDHETGGDSEIEKENLKFEFDQVEEV